MLLDAYENRTRLAVSGAEHSFSFALSNEIRDDRCALMCWPSSAAKNPHNKKKQMSNTQAYTK